jgi:hypothetical protein
MPRARKTKPLPDYLEELMAILEAQTEPDRQGAIQEVEGRHEGLQIDLAGELDEHEDFAVRYQRWWTKITLGLQDAQVKRALAGRGSASSALKEIRALGGTVGSPGGNGRLVLEKHHAARVAAHRRW